jgi:hypothetical protein
VFKSFGLHEKWTLIPNSGVHSKHKWRNHLTCHLNVCIHFYAQQFYTIENFHLKRPKNMILCWCLKTHVKPTSFLFTIRPLWSSNLLFVPNCNLCYELQMDHYKCNILSFFCWSTHCTSLSLFSILRYVVHPC